MQVCKCCFTKKPIEKFGTVFVGGIEYRRNVCGVCRGEVDNQGKYRRKKAAGDNSIVECSCGRFYKKTNTRSVCKRCL